jgi:hypothetical protein
MKNKELKETIYENVYKNSSEGYVITPPALSNEMISKLPSEVFTRDNSTFLDPICKYGTNLFEIVEILYNQGCPIKKIEKRIYTIDSNISSLNIANSYIKRIINRESGSFKVDFKSDFSKSFFDYAAFIASRGKFKTFDEFINKILIDKNKSYLMSELRLGISKFIERYEKISKLESKLFGEVFTPRQLIDEMLDTLPSEVWTNKDLKWLDPAVGIGNFPAAIVDRLMIGLSKEIKDDGERYKWIMEKMLYMCDISIKNLFLLYKLFDANNEFKLNVYRGSFLEEGFDKHMEEVWGLEGFDVVVGNPPYQDNTGNVGSGHTLWDKFVLKSLNILNINGYLTMVHPSGWRNISGSFEKVKQEFYKRNLIYLEIHNINDGLKVFNAATRYDFYCLKNSNDYEVTNIIDENGVSQKINIKNLKFIPNKYFSEFISLLGGSENKVDICFSNTTYDPRKPWMSDTSNDEFNLPCVKYISKVSGEIDFRYSKEDKGMFGKPKVLFGIGSQVGGIIIDEKGKYGLCQFVAGITDEVDNLENIQKALVSEKFKDIMKACQFTTQMYNYKIIQELKKDFWKKFI